MSGRCFYLRLLGSVRAGPKTPGLGRGEGRWGHRGCSSGAGCRLGRQLRAHQVQVGQGAEYEAPLRVLMQPTVAHLAKPENAFDRPKRVLHPGAVVGPDPVGGPLHAGQDPTPRALDLDAGCHVWGHLPQPVGLAHVGRIPPHIGLRPMQEQGRHLAVMHLRRSGGQMMDEAGLLVNPDVQFHAEIPLLPLARGMHLRVPLPRLILGGCGSLNQGGIHDRALSQAEAQARQMLLDQCEDARAQGMRFQEVAEFAQRSFIRHPRFQAQPGKMAHAQGIRHLFLGNRVGQVIPLLQTVETQHQFQIHPRPTPATLHHIILGRYQRHQFRPQQQLLHLGQKRVAAGAKNGMVSKQQGQGSSHKLDTEERCKASKSSPSLPQQRPCGQMPKPCNRSPAVLLSGYPLVVKG